MAVDAPRELAADEIRIAVVAAGVETAAAGAAAGAEMAAVVQKEIFKEELGDQDTLVFRARETRETAYTNAVKVEGLVMAQLALAQKNPTLAFKAATAVKMLALAAATLERTQAVKLRALGLDKENALPEEMPELIIRDLSKEELTALQERNESDEGGDLGIPIAPASTDSGFGDGEIREIDESDEIVVEGGEVVVEGEETEAAATPRPASLYPLGGRLVREHKP